MARSLKEAIAKAINQKQTTQEEVMQQPKIATQVHTITPAQAQLWMARNTHNRPLSKHVVKKYAKYMSDGMWQLNGEPIIFAADGSLMSGQHRLQACISAGVPFQSVVMTGVDRDAFATLDTHRRRTASDVLAIEGVKYGNRVAAAARAFVRIKHGSWTARNYTNQQFAEFVAAHPSLTKWGAPTSKIAKSFKSYVFGVLSAVADVYGDEITQDFYDKIIDGIGVSKTDPEYHLRTRLLTDKVDEETGIALTVKAINFSIEGRKIKQLKLLDTEAFPELIGL